MQGASLSVLTSTSCPGTWNIDMARAGADGYAAVLRQLHRLIGDLLSLDLAALDAPARTEIDAAFTQVTEAITSLERRVTPACIRQVAAQIIGIREQGAAGNLKVHLGAGSQQLPGWVNIDAPPSDLSVNLARGIPLPDQCAQFVFCSHLLEHLYYPTEVGVLLADCGRVLIPGGVLRIIVPDAQACLRAYVQRDHDFFNERGRQWPGWPADRTLLEDTLPYLGAFADPGGLYETHRFGFDFETLERRLLSCGFRRVTRSAYLESVHPELRVDHASEVAGRRWNGTSFSMFVEAVK